MTPSLLEKIPPELRTKASEGTLTPDDMRLIIKVLRGERVAAAQASDKARRAKAVKAIPSAEDLLKELGDL